MVVFLASSPTKELSEQSPAPALDARNGFVELLWERWADHARCLMIAAAPESAEENDEMTAYYEAAVRQSGLPVECFDLWDARHPVFFPGELQEYDVIFLAGGHVPTERDWFERIRLRELLEGFQGIVIGTSAGSMNAAREVYAWPEREGESEDPEYELFFEGLGLAETKLLPHYQKVKEDGIDGKLYVEIAAEDSEGHRFLLVPDGSYVLVENGVETVFGEAYLIADGDMELFCGEDDCRVCWPPED